MAHRLVLNDDGTITVPLKAPRGEPEPTPITLDEPSMDELATIHALVAAADEQLPKIPTIVDPTDQVEVMAAVQAGNARSIATYSKESPHGAAFLEILRLLGGPEGEAVVPAQLFGWVMNPSACAQVLRHFTAPLGGPAEPT